MHIQENISLTAYTTFGVEVSARYFVRISSVKEMQELISHPVWKENKRYILGGGSNVLFTQDFPGLVILVDIKGMKIVEDERDESIRVRVGAGENWHNLVMEMVSRGYWGIENLALIPGTVGAAPVQNIGAYGVEIKDTLLSVECLNLITGETEIFSKQECHFGYRTSIFKKFPDQYLVTHVALELSREANPYLEYESIQEHLSFRNLDTPSPRDIAEIIMEIRSTKLPRVGEVGMAGSFFKNPIISRSHFEQLQAQFPDIKHFNQPDGNVKIPAGWLIETLEYKGIKKGNVGTYERHALVVVNYGGATGEEVWNLAKEIMGKVQEKFGIRLEPEVIVI